MAVSGGRLRDFWMKFANAMGIPPEEAGPDGGYEVLFADGLRFSLRPWRDEAVFTGVVTRMPDSAAEAGGLARHLLHASLAKVAEWEETLYSQAGTVFLQRRLSDADDPDFSLEGVEKFLNRLDFWRRQVDYAESVARRQAPAAGGFIAYDQFG